MNRGKRTLLILVTCVAILIFVSAVQFNRTVQHERANYLLCDAIRMNDADAVLAALDAGADANAIDTQEETAPTWREVWKRFYDRLRHSHNKPMGERWTALQMACEIRGDPYIDGEAAHTNLRIIKALLDRGANQNIQLETGHHIPAATPFSRSCRFHDIELMRLLLEHGADVNARDEVGETPLALAAWTGKVEHISLLLKYGADIHAKTSYGGTVLMRAAKGGDPDVVRFILEYERDINTRDEMGWTALMYTCDSQYLQYIGQNPQYLGQPTECARLLLQHGADVNVRDAQGSTALSITRTNPNANIVGKSLIRLLQQYGARE